MTAATLFLVGCGQRQHTEQVTLVRIDTVKQRIPVIFSNFPPEYRLPEKFTSLSRYPEPCNVFMSMTGLLSVRVNLLPKWIRAITNFSYRRSKPNI